MKNAIYIHDIHGKHTLLALAVEFSSLRLPLRLDLVALAAVAAGVLDARIVSGVASLAHELRRALASEGVDPVAAGGAVATRPRRALVDVPLAVQTCKKENMPYSQPKVSLVSPSFRDENIHHSSNSIDPKAKLCRFLCGRHEKSVLLLTAESRSAVAPISVDEIFASAAVEARIGAALIHVHVAVLPGPPRVARALVSSGLKQNENRFNCNDRGC